MGLFDWLFGKIEEETDSRKRVFISFAIEDVQYRNYLVEQARKTKSPFDFIDMSVKKKLPLQKVKMFQFLEFM